MGRTLLEILHRGNEHRAGKPREEAARALDRYELARAGGADLRRRCPAGSRRGSRSCCWSCPGRRCCCSTSRPTTSTCTRPRRWRRGWTPSRARSWRSPTTGGSPAPSTGSWSSGGRRGLRGGRAGLGRGPGPPGALTEVVAARRSGICKNLQKLAVDLWRTGAGRSSLQRAARRGSARRRSGLRPRRRGHLCERPTQWRVAPARPAAPTPLERPWPDPVSSSRASWPRSSLPPARSCRSSPLLPRQPRPRGP